MRSNLLSTKFVKYKFCQMFVTIFVDKNLMHLLLFE